MDRKGFAEALNDYLENPDGEINYECDALGCSEKATQVIQTITEDTLHLKTNKMLKLCDVHMKAVKRGKKVWEL